jgi:ADP-heptose:LPS heptosyltransferase
VTNKILVRRTGALGDVILSTPVVRRLRRENPEAEIAVQTAYPDVFRDSPDRVAMLQPGIPPYAWGGEGGATVIDLDLAYERVPEEHVVRAYMLAAFGDGGDPADLQQSLAYKWPEVWPGRRPVVTVHAAKAGWGNRTLPGATWRAVCAMLEAEGLFPLLVGTGRDQLPGAAAAMHSTDLLAQAAVIARSACFVGSDSALLHAAGASQVPVAGVFTCARPETRLAWRNGEPGWTAIAVVPDMECAGCLAHRPPPATEEHCERGDTACVRVVTAAQIVAAVLQLIGEAR